MYAIGVRPWQTMAGEQDEDTTLCGLAYHMAQGGAIMHSHYFRVEKCGVVIAWDDRIISPILHVEEQAQGVELMLGEEVE